jgi:hypothetical protein
MIELLDKGPPIPNKNNIKAMMMIMKNPPPKIKSKGWSKEVKNFRITITHPFLVNKLLLMLFNKRSQEKMEYKTTFKASFLEKGK